MAFAKSLALCAIFLITTVHAYPRMYHDDDGSVDDKTGSETDRNAHEEHRAHAHSFQHFSGPVKGHHQEVSWKDKHGHHYHDYKAHPSYKFSYGVDDHHTKDYHGQKEHRDGKDVEGEYHVHEPGGNVRSVKYHADHHGGFFAEVRNYGGNDHSGGTYGEHKHKQ